MEKQFVTYEIALKLKELGFDEPCLAGYDGNKKLHILNNNIFPNGAINQKNIYTLAPLWQQVIDWFKEKYLINIEITRLPNIQKYGIVVTDMTIIPKEKSLKSNIELAKIITDTNRYESYEEARKQSILYAIELNKQFVTYEIALKLKELGFDEECLGYFNSKYEFIYPVLNRATSGNYVEAPLWQQVIDWFREKHNIIIELTYAGIPGKYYVFVKDYIYDNKGPKQFDYYEAREAGILKAIELIK